MTFASDDFDRHLFADSLVEVPGLRDVPGIRRAKFQRAVRDAIYKHINAGVRDEAQLCALVQAEMEEEYGSVILLAVIIVIVQFFVLKILKRLFPDKPEGSPE